MTVAVNYVSNRHIETCIQFPFEPVGKIRIDRISEHNALTGHNKNRVPGAVAGPVEVAGNVFDIVAKLEYRCVFILRRHWKRQQKKKCNNQAL